MIHRHKFDLLVLLETGISGDVAEEVCHKTKFTNNIRVEAKGFAGGIWLLWNESEINVTIKLTTNSFIPAMIKWDLDSYNLFSVYNPPTPARRVEAW